MWGPWKLSKEDGNPSLFFRDVLIQVPWKQPDFQKANGFNECIGKYTRSTKQSPWSTCTIFRTFLSHYLSWVSISITFSSLMLGKLVWIENGGWNESISFYSTFLNYLTVMRWMRDIIWCWDANVRIVILYRLIRP